ncbi:MAG: hypothetical protein DHS80DRAFT_28625 [Piptocephalis tieghemiana]|nr:MAG: hypothetical protein DHS80DRAFT_28625 [Piptocephalis tieghemiana]
MWVIEALQDTFCKNHPLILVVGAGSSLGQAISMDLATRGFIVLALHWEMETQNVLSRRWERRKDEAKRPDILGDIQHIYMDFNALGDMQSLTKRIEGISTTMYAMVYLGTPAGVRDTVQNLSEDELDDSRWVHMANLYRMAGIVQSFMPRGGFGRIVNVNYTSAWAIRPKNAVESVTSAASRSLCRTLATELPSQGIAQTMVEMVSPSTQVFGEKKSPYTITTSKSSSHGTSQQDEQFSSYERDVVVPEIRRALYARWPRITYYAGWEAKYQAFLYRVLGEAAMDTWYSL